MNINIIIPRRRRRNPNCLVRFARLIGYYRYYRRQNYRPAIAWQLAKSTI
jgi:hypothetical protein